VENVVNFALDGVTTAPELTPGLINHIWQEAYAHGYVPHGMPGMLEDNVPAQPPVAAAAASIRLRDGKAVIRRHEPRDTFEHRSQGFDEALRSVEQRVAH
jgi:hypothetical protein